MKDILIKLIDENEIISFDIFDTLLLRNIYKPTDIFRILDKIASDTYNIKDFYSIRVSSEMESRTEENNRECHYDEIYKVIEKKVKDKKIANKLKNEELKLEEKFLIVNPFMKRIYDYCIKKKKKILIISDMYLDEKFISKILKKNGYDKFKFYLSNKYQKTKGDTSLYEAAFLENEIDKEKWLHIGDNHNSDYLSPIKFGINAYHYKGVSAHTNIKEYSIFEAIILGIQNNYLYNGEKNDYWEEFGVKYISLIYFGFTKWLYDLTKNLGNLFFIARDGYIIEKIYNLFNKDNKVKTEYLYCSRNSFVIPSLYKVETEEFVKTLALMFNNSVDITLKDILLKCNVKIDELDNSLITAFGFKSFEDKITIDNIYYVKKLLIKLEDNIRKGLKDKYELAVKYLEQMGVNKYKNINIMDIGWAGSIQKSMKRLLNKDITGYYFGTVDEKQKKGFTTMFGYYFDLGYEKENKEEIIDNVMMYELIFSAPHGSTMGYEEKNGKIVPILKENIEYNRIIESFQDSAIAIINNYLEYIEYFDYLTKAFCVYPYKNFIKEKNYNDIKMFSKLSNDYILGSEKKFDYINTISEEDIQDDKKLIEISEQSLWKYTFILDNNFTEERYLFYKNKLYDNLHAQNPLHQAKVYLDFGDGFNEINTMFIPLIVEDGKYTLKINLVKISKDVHNVRIDPIENRKIVLRNLIIYSNEGNVEVEIPKKNYLLGKIRNGIYINSKDPRIIIKNTKNYKYIKFFANIELEK
ncbi:MAG: hypothetical protein IKF19_03535 [Bacilli bacterium]|nr:hypothetical protein [Bacilli bacterium]